MKGHCMKGIVRFIITFIFMDCVTLLHLCVISLFWTFILLTAVELVYLRMQKGIQLWVKPGTCCAWAGTALLLWFVALTCQDMKLQNVSESRISAVCTFAHSWINKVTSLYRTHFKLVDMFTCPHKHTHTRERERVDVPYLLPLKFSLSLDL